MYATSYHFAGSEGVFYAREPYSNPNAAHITRFIGLGAVGNDKKQVNLQHILYNNEFLECFFSLQDHLTLCPVVCDALIPEIRACLVSNSCVRDASI